ncbi:MAG: hypothetical protein WAZ98_00345 [Cyclobacteriaceae bacterium]
MSIDIAYIVSHGFAARMVTQTNLLGKLASAGKRVALICPDKNDPNLSTYCKAHGIQLIEFNVRKGFGDENYMFKRKYLLENIEDNPALLDKHIHAIRYNASLNPIKRIRPYYYWFLYKLIPFLPFIRKNFKRNETRNLKSAKAKNLIATLQPTKLVSTYPVNYNEAVLLYYGNKHPQVETWIHLLSWDNITCKGRFPEVADQYIAWGDIMKSELQEYYNVPKQAIHACGVPHFDLHYSVKNNPSYSGHLEELNLNSDRPYLFFAMSSPRFAPKEIDIVEWLAAQIKSGEFGDNMQLVVRPHPQNVVGNLSDKNWLPRLRALNTTGKIAVDFPTLSQSKLNWSMDMNDMERMAKLISGSCVTLNSGSTMSIDALSQEKPVIITAFDANFKLDYWRSSRRLVDYVHLKKLIQLGGVSVVNSYIELRNVISHYLINPGWNADQRREAIRNELYRNDGESTNRVVEVLINS